MHIPGMYFFCRPTSPSLFAFRCRCTYLVCTSSAGRRVLPFSPFGAAAHTRYVHKESTVAHFFVHTSCQSAEIVFFRQVCTAFLPSRYVFLYIPGMCNRLDHRLATCTYLVCATNTLSHWPQLYIPGMCHPYASLTKPGSVLSVRHYSYIF